MNNTSKQLVSAVRDALVLRRLRTKSFDTLVEEASKVATVAVLRQLAIFMNTAELDEIADPASDEDWPDAGDLTLLADDVESTL